MFVEETKSYDEQEIEASTYQKKGRFNLPENFSFKFNFTLKHMYQKTKTKNGTVLKICLEPKKFISRYHIIVR